MPSFHRYTPLLALLALVGCAKFEDSPYALDTGDLPQDVNAHNIARLLAHEPFADDTVTLLFTGDSQRFYEEQDALVDQANALPDVDFFILAGDLVDFGLAEEFAWTYERMDRLKMPWVTVIGNHDLQANGPLIYRHMFGPLDFSFTYKGFKFLFHDTNGREYGHNGTVPDLGWLGAQLADPAPAHFIAVSHVPPMNGDFDPALVGPYTAALAAEPRTLLSLHAHTGSYVDGRPFGDHVRYIVCDAMSTPRFLLVKLHGDSVWTRMVDYTP